MTTITIFDRSYDIDCIVFDKDGTLIDLETFWGPRVEHWGGKLAELFPECSGIQESIFETIGYSPKENIILPESPLAVASIENLNILAAGALFQHGLPWHKAKLVVDRCAQNTLGGLFDPSDIHPIGDVAGALQIFAGAQITIAVVTSDDRKMTRDTLASMDIENLVNILVCGDDDIPNKPAPDAIWRISEILGIPSSRMIMIGDTVSDMEFGRNAGVAGLVGVHNGDGINSFLAAHADIVIDSIDKITVNQ